MDFFKARGERNYRGQTIEHVCCMLMQREIVEDINPQPDTRDYYGNLPLFYTVMNNDELNAATFQHGKNYYHLRNYKQETLFHVAAKHNSVQALETLNKRAIFFEELIKKDFKGDTPFHLAAKAGALEMMRYLMRSATAPFLSIQNDFGLTPRDAAKAKMDMLEERRSTAVEPVGERASPLEEKIYLLRVVVEEIDSFDEWVTQERWDKRFDMPYEEFMKKADPDLKIFMGFE